MKKIVLVALASLACIGVALAQVISIPQVQSLGQTDLVQVIPQGLPSAPELYATPGAIAGVEALFLSDPADRICDHGAEPHGPALSQPGRYACDRYRHLRADPE